jgi:hypothetical protein
MNIQHSSRNDDWMTPVDIIRRVKLVLKEIDFDPASSYQANERVGAKLYYSQMEDGLVKPWPEGCSIFCNPPGGKVGNKSKTGLFWQRLMAHKDRFSHAIFLCFSVEAFQSTQGKGVASVGEFPFCIPKKRIKFDFTGDEKKTSPSHSNAIIYVPGWKDERELFKKAFEDLGLVRL